MKSEIVGVRRLNTDITNRETNKTDHIDGIRFHFTRKDRDVTGVAAESKYFSTEQLRNFGVAIPDDKLSECIGKTLDIEYNQFGRAANVVISDEYDE